MPEESILIVPEPMQALTWAEDDGPIPYVFSDRPAGHRCAWSVYWQTKGGIVTPDDWLHLKRATMPELYYELLDVRDRESHSRQDEAEGLLRGGASPDAMPNKKEVIKFLAVVRESRAIYKEYSFPLNEIPGNILLWRPGWAPVDIDPLAKRDAALRRAESDVFLYFRAIRQGNDKQAAKSLAAATNNPEVIRFAGEIVK